MIRHLSHSEIDKTRWDAVVDTSSNGIVYAKSWYLDMVSPQWDALVEDDYKTIFPLTWRKKYGVNYLFPPFFTQQLGIFSEEKNIWEEKIKSVLSAIPEKFRFIEIQLNHQNKFNSDEFEISERLTHHLNLNNSNEEIKKSYSENLKRNLKKANQNSLEVTGKFSVIDLIKLFRSQKGSEVNTLREEDYLRFEKLMNVADEKNLLFKSGIVANGKLSAGAIFLKSNHEYVFIFSATDEAARESGAMSFVIDDFISKHAGEKTNLDFEGSMDKNLSRFYKSFGAEEVVYLQIKKNRLPFPFNLFKK